MGGFNRWTINGVSFDEKAQPRTVQKGKRYRLVFDNQTDDAHPIHLHRSGEGLQTDRGGCHAGHHQQLHMDYGFKLLFNVV